MGKGERKEEGVDTPNKNYRRIPKHPMSNL